VLIDKRLLILSFFLIFHFWPGFLPPVMAAEPEPEPVVVEAEEIPPEPKEPVYLRMNLPAHRLDLYINDSLKGSYPIAIGMPRYPTPIRNYNISMIVWNPWWIPPDSDWAKDAKKTPPGPGNPLGVVKMIMESGIRIHGTNHPSSIGRALSHACLRMHNEDAREVAWAIQSRYSEKDDPELLEKYRRNRRSTYWVKLFQTVPVYTEYIQVERKDDRLVLHPNPYWHRGFEAQLADALKDHPEINLDKNLIKKLNKMRRRKTVEIPLQEVLSWGKPYTATPSDKPQGQPSPEDPLVQNPEP
jgi:hypothetical protein